METLKNIKNGTVISQYDYVYDNNGNITAVTETTEAGSQTAEYQYDALNRLTGILRPNKDPVEYQYDARGNRIQTTGAPSYQDYVDRVANNAGNSYQYEYDAENLRTKKIAPEGTTRYHLDNSGRVIAESNASDEVTAQNIWGHKMLARKVDVKYYYYLYNGHGDVVQIMDESGNIVNRYSYDEWGNIVEKTEGISNPIRYAGEYYDEESGLYYLRARYYDPTIGRFITRDSYEGDISNPLTINLYTYCRNNPLIFVDPSGHMEVEDKDILSAQDYAIMQAITVLYGMYETAGNTAMKEEMRSRAVSIRQKDEYSGKYSNSDDGGTYIDSYEYYSSKYQNKISNTSYLTDVKVDTEYVIQERVYIHGGSPQTTPK